MVDGVRGENFVGKAEDVKGSQAVDTSDRDTDVGDGRFKLDEEPTTTSAMATSTEQDEKTTRETLRFFFSPEGQVFRDFLLEEVVTTFCIVELISVKAFLLFVFFVDKLSERRLQKLEIESINPCLDNLSGHEFFYGYETLISYPSIQIIISLD